MTDVHDHPDVPHIGSLQTSLLDRVSDMVTVSDRDGRIVYANAATEHVTGYAPEIFTKRHPFESIHPDDLPRCEKAIARLIENPGLNMKIEHRILHADGTWRWVEVTLENLFDDPAVGGLLATVRDVTERKVAEVQQEFRLKLSDALRPLGEPVDIEETITRTTMDHFAADRCYYTAIEGDSATIRRDASRGGLPSVAGTYSMSGFALFERVVAEGRPLIVHDANVSEVLDEKLRDLCLELQVISFVDVPIIKNGKAVGILCLVQSTPREWIESEVALAVETAERTWAAVERARAEEAVQASEEQLRTLVEQSPLAINIFAPDGTSLRSNQSWRTLWNLDPGDDFTRENIFDDEQIAATGLLPCLQDGANGRESVTDPVLYDPTSMNLEGEKRWFRAFVYPVLNVNNCGEVVQVVLMLQDATDSKLRAEERSRMLIRDTAMRAEKLERERISRELHDRVAQSIGVAHQSLELYKALTVSDPERAQERLDLASRITRDVLNQTRNLAIELRHSVAEEVENGLRPALESMLKTLVPDNIRSRLHFRGNESNIPNEATAQVYLVLREAVNNACRHSKCSEIEVRVDVEREEGYVRAVVADDGEGFDYDVLNVDENKGIGLRAMLERVELLGGEMDMHSSTEEGTTVTVTIPLTRESLRTSHPD